MGIKSKFSEFAKYKTNIEKAVTMLKGEWNNLNKDEQDTFLSNSPFNRGTTKDPSGFFAFMNYFVRKFSQVNTGQTINHIDLRSGSSKNYIDRTSRTFNIS